MKNIIFLLTVITCGCELVIKVDQPPFQPSIVMGSYIGPDTTIVVTLSEDRHVLEMPYDFNRISEATVQLFEGDQLIGVLEEFPPSDEFISNPFGRGIYGLDFRPTAGVEYRLEVSKSGFTSVQATDRLPESGPMFEVVSMDMNESTSGLEIEIKLLDEPGRDYYEVLAYLTINTFQSSFNDDTQTWEVDSIIRSTEFLDLYTENIAVEEYNNSLFSDRLFDGRSYELDMESYLYVWQDPNIDAELDPVLIVEVRRVSEAYFNFSNSAALQYWVDGDPFAEPVQAFSNVENGRGVFGSYVSTRQEFPIELNQ